MAAKLVKTNTPGVYRRGSRYVVKQRDRSGRMLTRSAPTLAAARDVKAELRTNSRRGERQFDQSPRFDAHAPGWIKTYNGRTRRGFRASTRAEYERALRIHATPFFGRIRLSEITPQDIKLYGQECADDGLGYHGVKNALCPVKALLADAFEEGLIRNNPSAGVRAIPAILSSDGHDEARALTPSELEQFIAQVPVQHQFLVTFLARTGLRIGEAVELRWGDVEPEAGVLHVRRGFARGVVGPPKSKFGIRTIPLTDDLRTSLALYRMTSPWNADQNLVFTTRTSTRISARNLRERIINPASERASLPWVGFHTMRHTFASICFNNGCNAKQVQLMLGHHKASFTLDTYVHSTASDLPSLDFMDQAVLVA